MPYPPSVPSSSKPLAVIYAAIALDAIGIGLVFPILPRLIETIGHRGQVAAWIGALAALYAAMQFLCAPMLGALSDRLGRRPVLLVSMTGAAVDYLLMALAPSLWLLAAGRAIAGLTSANLSVATAYLTDITPEPMRARRFGMFNAMFGLGFILGPVLGGALGDHGLRLPFVAAAGLNAANLLLALFMLPESRSRRDHGRLALSALNPLRPLGWIFSTPALLPLVAVFFVLAATGEAYGTCWALWGGDAFGWNGLWIGLSLATFGVCQAAAQALLPGPAVRLLGERRTVLLGIAGACCALLMMAFIRQGWMVFAVMPLVALAGIGAPALQSLATRQVDPGQQGRFQGVLASATSLASVVGPLFFATFYMVTRARWPGAVWLSALAVNLLAVPIVLGLRFYGPACPQVLEASDEEIQQQSQR